MPASAGQTPHGRKNPGVQNEVERKDPERMRRFPHGIQRPGNDDGTIRLDE